MKKLHNILYESHTQKETLINKLCELPEVKEVYVSKKTYQLDNDVE